jgi:PAS domain-containing protein
MMDKSKSTVRSILTQHCQNPTEIIYRLRVFENRAMRRIFGLKREEGVGGWRTLHNGELHNSYTSPNVIRQGRACGMDERNEKCI